MIIEQKLFDSILVSAGVRQEEIESCLQWAVGNDVDLLGLSEFFDRWNEKHSDLFFIDDDTDLTFDEVISEIGLSYLRQMEI